MESIWTNNTPPSQFKTLDGNKNTDVLIIGGGIAGILCAYKFKNAGVDYILTEAKDVFGGITQNTTAKITFLHSLVYDNLIKRYGQDIAQLYLNAQTDAAKEYSKLCQDIDCDYETTDSYVYSLTNRRKIEKEIIALKALGVKALFSNAGQLPFEVAGAVKVSGHAQFNPLKFLTAIAKDLNIYTNTKVLGLKPHSAVTNRGEIAFKKVIVATHFPILNKHGSYFLKLYQHRSYVIALRDAQSMNGMYVDECDKGLSFRNYGDLLLLGGGGHRTGKKGGSWQELEDFANKYYKNAEIVGKWATQDCMTLDNIPYIGQYSKSTPNTFVATGFNKWGMTNAMVAADILYNLVCGKTTPYTKVFSPSRSILHPQLAINALETTVGLLTPTSPRCPHLGCALKYNRAEHTWDCPCHGSRFTKSGQLIDNPATDDKK